MRNTSPHTAALASSIVLLAGAIALSSCSSTSDSPLAPGTGVDAGSSGTGGTSGDGGTDGGSGGGETGGSGGTGVGGAGGGDTGGSGGATGGAGGGDTGGSGGATGGAGGGDTGGAGGATGGSGGGDPSCPDGADGTVQDVAMGTVAVGTQVQLTNVVATSQKVFLVKSNNTGSCLWGLFVRDASQPYGTMIVNYGDKAPADGAGGFGDCPSGTDLIPNNVVPGDVLSIRGQVDAYAPSTCTNNPPKQVQVKACDVIKVSGGPAPTPVVASAADVMAGKTELQGLLVKIENVTAEDWPDGGTVGPYGIIKLQGSGLEIHDKFYYKNAVGGGAPVYDPSQQFTSVTGVVHLDYCLWVLQPRNKCSDFNPASKDCP